MLEDSDQRPGFKSRNASEDWSSTKPAFFPSGLFLGEHAKQWQNVSVSSSLLK